MPETRSRARIVAVGQTPPPLGGQAIAIESFVTGRYARLEVFHVRMSFSRRTAEIGKPRIGKLVHLVGLILRILWCRAQTGATVLYYPPAGPDLVPVLRDVVILLCTRWAFRSTVFHFHASGLSEIERRLRPPLRLLFRAAYGGAALAIQTSALNPPDGQRLGARRVAVIANGVRDHPLAETDRDARPRGAGVVLYAGVLAESKGILVLVDACRQLHEQGFDLRLGLMGAFESPQFESTLRTAIDNAQLTGRVEFLGSLTGDAKAARFRASDVFCYPTYFPAESFGIVLVEAMQFSLPVVASRWRGVASVVADGKSGILVPVRDSTALAAALGKLLTDPGLRRQMGRRGRELYLERFTEQRYRDQMEAVLSEL